MKRLVICEKPSLAQFFTSCVKEKFTPMKAKNSDKITYYESPNYYVTYSFGHLFNLYEPEDYDGCSYMSEWQLDTLPFFPPSNEFQLKLHHSKNKNTGEKMVDPVYSLQFETIKVLVNDVNTEAIIHCGDAAREGEVIIREILDKTNFSNKPVIRLWLESNSQEGFNEAFSNMLPDSAYDHYNNEGIARMYDDWIYGINLSRYVSLKVNAPKGRPFRVGRVLCAMVWEIYDREMEIKNFIPQKYYAILSDAETSGNKIELRSSQKYEPQHYNQGKDRCVFLNENEVIVTDIKTVEKTVGPGKLFSLTTLKNKLSTTFKMSQIEAMKHIESLYLKGYISYPRTGTEYLPENEKNKVMMLVDVFNQAGYDLEFRDSKQIFDSSKVEDHGAICPTAKIPMSLPKEEQQIYETIRNRFLAVFCKEPCRVNKSTMTIQSIDEEFKLSGTVKLTDGWRKYEECETKDTYLPPLQVGDKVNVNFHLVEETTKPPPRYSVSTFNNFLDCPFTKADIEEEDDKERYEAMLKGITIGTVASRDNIFFGIFQCGYFLEKNQVYYLQPAGQYLIESMMKLGIYMNKEKTVEVSVILKKVFNGEMSVEEAVHIAEDDLTRMLESRDTEISSCIDEGIVSKSGYVGEPVGTCPACGGNVYETSKGFICENNIRDNDECFFYINKDDAYFKKLTGKSVSAANVSSILNTGSLIIKTKTKNNIEYETMLRICVKENNRIGWDFFRDIGTCPVCRGTVQVTPFGYICENNTQENPQCFFILFRNDKFITACTGKQLNLKQAISILKKGNFTTQIEKKDKSGKYKKKFILNIDRIAKKLSWNSEFVNTKPKNT